MPDQQKQWNQQSHESKVERFYGTGAENYGNFHGGYLNFGLWEAGNTDYLAAAEHLVLTLGNMLNLRKTSRLLDVGCGMGSQDILLHNTFQCAIDAVDVTWKHVQHARQRVQHHKLEHVVRIHHGTATNIPFPDKTFSHVLSIEAPEHFNTREAFFNEAYRVLKPKGTIVLADYSMERKPTKLWETFFFETARTLWHVPKANVDNVHSYTQKMMRAGFSNITIQKVGAKTIPGYYAETRKKETIQAMQKIRGHFITHASWFLDYTLLKAYQYGLVEYILVKAEKK